MDFIAMDVIVEMLQICFKIDESSTALSETAGALEKNITKYQS